jgi:hypothetical protein
MGFASPMATARTAGLRYVWVYPPSTSQVSAGAIRSRAAEALAESLAHAVQQRFPVNQSDDYRLASRSQLIDPRASDGLRSQAANPRQPQRRSGR